MVLRKHEYFRIFSKVINIQLGKGYGGGVVDLHKREYLELSENKNQGNFSLNGKHILL